MSAPVAPVARLCGVIALRAQGGPHPVCTAPLGHEGAHTWGSVPCQWCAKPLTRTAGGWVPDDVCPSPFNPGLHHAPLDAS